MRHLLCTLHTTLVAPAAGAMLGGSSSGSSCGHVRHMQWGVHAAASRPRSLAPRQLAAMSATPAAAASVLDEQWAVMPAWRLTHLVDAPKLVTHVAGVSFEDRQANVAMLAFGGKQAVVVAADPSNPWDPHAVAVYTAGMRQLGYIPREATGMFPLAVTFGTVVSRGRAAGSSERLWGVRVALAPTVHGLWLDPLPGSWQQRCDLAQVLGSSGCQEMQHEVLQAWGHRCGITSTPLSALPSEQQQLAVVPQWGFDQRRQQVYLAGVLPVCQGLVELKQQLQGAAQQLAALPAVQAAHADITAALDTMATMLPLWAEHDAAGIGEEEAAQPEHAAWRAEANAATRGRTSAAFRAIQQAAASGLSAPQLVAIERLRQLMDWEQLSDCHLYMLQAEQRRQQLADESQAWQLLEPSAQDVARVVAAARQAPVRRRSSE